MSLEKSETMAQALANYQALLAKVDAKFSEIQTRQASSMSCARGCHACCRPGLTVSRVEAESIRRRLSAEPARAKAVLAVEAANPHAGARCKFLTADGACGIYDVRPIVCRSHGAPVTFKLAADKPAERDVCPLNFKDRLLAAVDPADFINLDTLNTILALINGQISQDTARTPLTPSALTGE